MYHSDQEMRGAFVTGLCRGQPFGERRHDERLMPPPVIPGARVRHFPVTPLPNLTFLAAPHQGECRSRNYRNIGAADDLKQTQRVCNLLVSPLISADHCDPQDFYLWRLNHHQRRLHVAAAGARAVLVDDYFAPQLGERKETPKQPEKKKNGGALPPLPMHLPPEIFDRKLRGRL